MLTTQYIHRFNKVTLNIHTFCWNEDSQFPGWYRYKELRDQSSFFTFLVNGIVSQDAKLEKSGLAQTTQKHHNKHVIHEQSYLSFMFWIIQVCNTLEMWKSENFSQKNLLHKSEKTTHKFHLEEWNFTRAKWLEYRHFFDWNSLFVIDFLLFWSEFLREWNFHFFTLKSKFMFTPWQIQFSARISVGWQKGHNSRQLFISVGTKKGKKRNPSFHVTHGGELLFLWLF